MSIRTTKPGAGNKYYIRQATGGYSTCIQGKPTDPNCNVLANCVGYANGAFNEELGLNYEKYHLNCNAENFIERAIASGLSVVKEPVLGGIMVWQKGATLSGDDGAGHVAVCIAKNSGTQVKTAESGYGSSAFWTTIRDKGNGNWGAGTGYTYRGCIVNPNVKEPEPTPPPTPTPTPTWPKSYTVQKGDTLSGIASKFYGNGDAVHYNFIAQANGISNPNIIQIGAKLTIPEFKGSTQRTHTVRQGENLSTIAKKYGTTWQKIYNDNKAVIGNNPNLIKPGQVLVIN